MDKHNKQNKSISTTKLIKQMNQELMQVTYVAMIPGVDLTGDFTSELDVRLAKESFHKSAQRTNLFHVAMTDSFSVIESYLAPVDMQFEVATVTKGSWLITLQINSEELWQMIKSGEINGISIGATAYVEPYNEDEEYEEDEDD